MRPSTLAFAALASLAATAGAARAQTSGRIFFLNQQTGDFVVGGVGHDRLVHFPSPGKANFGTEKSLIGVTNVAAANDGIVAYNQTTGYAEIVVIDGLSDIEFIPNPFSSGWKTILGTGGYLYFYDGVSSAAAVSLHQGGEVDNQPYTFTGLSTWTSIVQTENYLVFYNFHNGAVAEGVFSPVGQTFYQPAQSSLTTDTNCGLVAPIGLDQVLLYNTSNGKYDIVYVGTTGNGTDYIGFGSSGTLPTFLGAAVEVGGRVVLYGYGNGTAVVGYVSPRNGIFTKAQQKTLPLYSSVVSTGPYFIGYQQLSGLLDIYDIERNGTLALVATQTAPTGYTSLTVTHS